MGKRSTTSGVVAVRDARIRFDFRFQGKRYRPSILRPPTEANLRRARERLVRRKRMSRQSDELCVVPDALALPSARTRVCAQSRALCSGYLAAFGIEFGTGICH